MKLRCQIYLKNVVIVGLCGTAVFSQTDLRNKGAAAGRHQIRGQSTVDLSWIDPGVMPFSGYRWCDVAGNLYSDSYRNTYRYDNSAVQVQVSFEERAATLHGQLSAVHLKPNFAYQMKLNGIPLSSGVYFVVLSTQTQSITGKIVLIK
jgi:hypothetical protein